MQSFNFTGLSTRVVFGDGTLAQLADELRALGCSRAIVLCTAQQVAQGEALIKQLGSMAVSLFSDAAMHTPVDVTERALAQLQDAHADCIVAIGGGSTIGLSKALALRTDIKQIVIPTTYAGSEATPIIGETQNGVKTTQRTVKVLPEVVIYDVALTLSLPVAVSSASGMNAIAHAVEALYAKDANPLTSTLAIQGIQALTDALPKIQLNPSDKEARSNALYGAWLCGLCLAQVGMSLHHKLCHTVGGSFNLPHAETHSVILPHAVAYNASAAPHAMQQITSALGVNNAAQGLFDLASTLKLPTSLEALGMSEEQLTRATDLALANPYWSPRAIERAGIAQLLEDAFHGRRPAAN